MYRHLPIWISFLEKQLGRSLRPDDYVFPVIAINGLIYPESPITHDAIQKHLTNLTSQAGLKRSITTHSFRRGGAQHRFMFAPLGQRWSLSIIRWWGGWAPGEHVSWFGSAHRAALIWLGLGRHPNQIPCR